MKHFLILIIVNTIIWLNAFGQEGQTNEILKREITPKVLLGNWQHYATNNPYTKRIIQQKYNVETQIALLQKKRSEFIAKDHYNTYKNTPYLIIDDNGHSRAYRSREEYDDEIIGGLIKSSLKINDEIIKQKNLYFAAYGSNLTFIVTDTNPASPTNLNITNN